MVNQLLTTAGTAVASSRGAAIGGRPAQVVPTHAIAPPAPAIAHRTTAPARALTAHLAVLTRPTCADRRRMPSAGGSPSSIYIQDVYTPLVENYILLIYYSSPYIVSV
ncbi:hypothetical protein EVAR_71432_1 [Eumeta japonica]|uniref:Uncharacterized protein n=1 Tax=Eumeta variegata TaxID=151549 RepID=A0A4C1SF32_EUMVA|nr:hypothetical protein EVAR_71432_1 [Eumeta japonica]